MNKRQFNANYVSEEHLEKMKEQNKQMNVKFARQVLIHWKERKFVYNVLKEHIKIKQNSMNVNYVQQEHLWMHQGQHNKVIAFHVIQDFIKTTKDLVVAYRVKQGLIKINQESIFALNVVVELIRTLQKQKISMIVFRRSYLI